MARMFVAAWPPPSVLDKVTAATDGCRSLAAGAGVDLRWTSREKIHVTLRFLGEVADADVGPLTAALEGTALGPAAEASVGPAVARFGHRVLHVPVAGLAPLAGAVTRATASFGEPPEDRPFHGHLTIARPRGRGRVDLGPLCTVEVVARWSVDEVTLVRSAGGRYDVVGSVPLA